MDNTVNTVKVLVINSGVTPIQTEKYEFAETEGLKVKETVLAALNRMGKAAHALIKYKGKLWVADHTAEGNTPSAEYFRHEVKYHPFASEI